MNVVRRTPAVLSPQESDGELLARLADGDTSALGTLYERHHEAIRRFAARASGSTTEAEDITHATFLTVAKIAPSFDGRLSCRPWLFGVAARTLSHRRRGAGRLSRFLEKLGWTAIGEKNDPRDALEARAERSGLERALDGLTDAKRTVIVMFEIEEMSGEEIAEALSIPVGTVWTRLHAARRELRARMEDV